MSAREKFYAALLATRPGEWSDPLESLLARPEWHQRAVPTPSTRAVVNDQDQPENCAPGALSSRTAPRPGEPRSTGYGAD